ncbi:unnamed protein product, partial [Iphiclides podalirius]
MDARLLLVALCFVSVFSEPEYVIKKRCKDVDAEQCRINNVKVDPCPRSPNLCIIKPEKSYSISVDFTPKFSAKSLKLAMYSDEKKTNLFETAVRAPQDGCGLLTCPLQAEERRNFDVHFQLAKMSPGKFPIKMKLWNEEDESQACCFTFNVKVRK